MSETGVSPFPPPAREEDFDEWLRVPVRCESPDPRIEVRRALPSEFERIYDLIDEAFGFKRPRALSDWIYRRNPYGVARCWVSVERATGKLVGSVVNWPWPLARGARPLPAAQGGDAVVARGWQRQGIHELAGKIRESHPWIRSIVNYGWPNPGSVRRVRKADKAPRLIGALPQRTLPLRTRGYLSGRGLPPFLADAGGRMLDSVFATWSRSVLRKPLHAVIEPVRRFDSAFDDITGQCMPWQGYWSPHDSEFLNWRYFAHPLGDHLAFALTIGSRLSGYLVLHIRPRKALLMELVAPGNQPRAASALLLHAIEVAADAGCSRLTVAAPPAWRYWQLLRFAGFVAAPPEHVMYAYSWRDDTPGVQALESWQFLGGDLDPFVA